VADTHRGLEAALMEQWSDGARAGVEALTGAVEAVLAAQEKVHGLSYISNDAIRAALQGVSEGLIQELGR